MSFPIKAPQIPSQFIPHPPKLTEPLLPGPLHRRRIVKTPMQSRRTAKENWTTLLRVIANRNDIVKILSSKLIHMLRLVRRNIDPDLLHHRDSLSPNAARFRARAFHQEPVSRIVPQQSLRHLRPRGIPRAQNQHPLFSIHIERARGARSQRAAFALLRTP